MVDPEQPRWDSRPPDSQLADSLPARDSPAARDDHDIDARSETLTEVAWAAWHDTVEPGPDDRSGRATGRLAAGGPVAGGRAEVDRAAVERVRRVVDAIVQAR